MRSILTSPDNTKLAARRFCMIVVAISFSGCRPQDQIERYQVARPKSPHRMLGAIVPRGERGWFFKLTGANEIVDEQADKFTTFIKSIQFGEGDDSDPAWTLPEGWIQEPGKDMRFATVKIPTGEQSLELTVIPLPLPPGDGILSNINRWRGQLGLASVDDEGLAKESTSVELVDGTAILVNLVGKSGASPPMSLPAVSRGASDADAARIAAHAAAGVEEPATANEAAPPPPSITYDAPDHWEPGQRVKGGTFAVAREAAFIVEEDGKVAEITVTALAAAAGAVGPNVNRWRSQVGLDPLTEEQLAEEANVIDMHGVEGQYFRLVGSRQAILGVIAMHGGKSWFVKLQGSHDLAVKLQEDFEAFARSIKF